MRVERLIPVAQIVWDRLPLNPSTLDLVRYLDAGGAVPAIKVRALLDGRYEIRDGRHRLLAHKLLGRTHILAKWGADTRENFMARARALWRGELGTAVHRAFDCT